jgi:hypothetical protein
MASLRSFETIRIITQTLVRDNSRETQIILFLLEADSRTETFIHGS